MSEPCPECGVQKKDERALAIHRSWAHGIRSTNPKTVAERERKRRKLQVVEGEGSSPSSSPVGATADSPSPSAPIRRGLFAPRERAPKAERAKPALRPGSVAEGLSMVYSWAGGMVSEAERAQGRLGTTGRAMQITAPTAGRLLDDLTRRFPGLHNLLIGLLGTGAGMMDAQAVIGIPIMVRRMERNPETIPGTLPIVRAQMRPIMRDMLKALREQRKIETEIAELQTEIGEMTGGVPFSIDQVILVDMLGLPPAAAVRILNGESIEAVFGRSEEEPATPGPAPAEAAAV